MGFNFKFVYLMLFIWSLNSYSSCKVSGKAKKCPSSGTTLLDDTYPSAAYVISNKAFKDGSENAEKLPSEFILKVFKAHKYAIKGPKVVVPSTPASYQKIREDLKQKIKDSNGKIPESILDNVVRAEGSDYTWQQDYFESFFDPTTGNPSLRGVESYKRGVGSPEEAVQLLTEAMDEKSCKPKSGPLLKHSKNSRTNGEMGGNIEGLPGGSCLVGANAGLDYIEQFCGDKENIVQIDVGWLTVGHVDELVKVIPSKDSKDECGFSIMIASPSKAIELLGEPRFQNQSFFNLSPNTEIDKEVMVEYRTSGKSGTLVCSLLKNKILPTRGTDNSPNKDGNGNKIKQVFNQFFLNSLITSAHAGSGAEATSNFSCEKNLLTMTNVELRNAFNEDEDLKKYNELVQEKMNESKKKIEAQILKKLPQCKGQFNFIEVPNLFSGVLKENEDGTKELPLEGNGDSLLPNPTNSVIANKTMLFSDTQNANFNEYLKKEMNKNGLEADFLDTWEYAHLGDGNLHCSTHTIPYCRP